MGFQPGTTLDFRNSNLTSVDFRGAYIDRANFYRAIVDGAMFGYATIVNSIYSPKLTVSPSKDIEGIRGIEKLSFREEHIGGLVLLRKMFRELGDRDLERRATYAIEKTRVRHYFVTCSRPGFRFWTCVHGMFRWAFFELPVGWGFQWWNALFAWLSIYGLMAIVYGFVIWRQSGRCGALCCSRIFRVHSKEHLSRLNRRAVTPCPGVAECPVIGIADGSSIAPLRPLKRHRVGPWALGLYFSLLSGVHIGWRYVRVGSWIARIHPREFELRSYGYVRVLSGIQSLISIYLLTIWAVTYFGRPFD